MAGDKHISVRGKNNLMVYSNRPLPPFADEEMVDASTRYVLPDLFPIAPTIDLRKQHVWKPENITGNFHLLADTEIPTVITYASVRYTVDNVKLHSDCI